VLGLRSRQNRLAFRLFAIRLEIKHHEEADHDEERTNSFQ
jgi:hypothetical protein